MDIKSLLRELYLMRDCGINYTSYRNRKYEIYELIKMLEWKEIAV